MKYLSSQPFTIAVSSPTSLSAPRWLTDRDAEERRKQAAQPHEYLNGGSMCSLCGLDERAKIHENY